MIKRHVNENSSDRDVKPDRHGPAPNAAMSIPPALENRNERDDDQRQSDEREQNVRDQNRKINPRDQAMIAGGLFAGMRVIDDVTDKKTARRNQRDDHARHVTLPDIAPDPEPSHRNENCADGIQRGVDGGKIRDGNGHC